MKNQLSDWIWALVGGTTTLIYAIAASIWGRKNASVLLNGWARANEFVLVSAQRRSFVPFLSWGGSTSGYQFFRVTIQDKSGAVRRSWIRCSDFVYTNPKSFEVIWDDNPK